MSRSPAVLGFIDVEVHGGCVWTPAFDADDGTLHHGEAAFAQRVGKQLAALFGQPRMRLEGDHPEALLEIERGIFAVVKTDVVDKVSVHRHGDFPMVGRGS